MPDKIDNGVVVSLQYTLVVDGEEIDSADSQNPLEYLHGAQNIVPGLEQALAGKAVGDRVQVTLPPEAGYGEYSEEEIDEFGKDELPDSSQLEAGMFIEVEDEEGYVYEGVIQEITEDAVIVDFNHPLAGKTLNFDVTVLSLRQADDEEIAHGHPHSMAGYFEDEDDWDDEDMNEEGDWDDDFEDDNKNR